MPRILIDEDLYRALFPSVSTVGEIDETLPSAYLPGFRQGERLFRPLVLVAEGV